MKGFNCILARTKKCSYDGFSTDIDHIKTRGSGGTDHEDNLMPLCRRHHQQKHAMGIKFMAETYSAYKQWLLRHNWIYCQFMGKWRYSAKNKVQKEIL